MAISIGATKTTSAGVASPATTETFSHTVDAGTTMLIVGYSAYRTPGTPTMISATWNGVAMTILFDNNDHADACIFYLANPTPGTANIVVTWTSAADGIGGAINILGSATTWDGVGIGNSNIGGGSQTAGSQTSHANGSLYIAVGAINSQTITAAETQQTAGVKGVVHHCMETFAQVTAGAKSMFMTFGGSSGNWSMAAGVLNPALPVASGFFMAAAAQ